jgi:hypothetical protein
VKDVRTVRSVEDSRTRLEDATEAFEKGAIRIGTLRDIFRLHLTTVAEARGGTLGAVASEAAE